MKSSYKIALLAAIGLTSVTAAQAYTSGDLLVGVYESDVANTEVVDLGSYSSLFNNDSISLASALASAGFSSTLASTAQFGVFGAVTTGSGTVLHTTYETTTGFTPNTVSDYSDFGSLKSQANTILTGAQGVGNGSDFFTAITLGDGGLADLLGYSVAGPVTGGVSLYSIVDNGSAPVLDGTFTLNSSTETLTYNAAPVPEPSTLGLLGGVGMLALVFRNKLARKQA